ncbi:subclass B3 metallo-beta-lactamase [Sphingomonas sp. HF-S3]|uniref:Subclass B3 metallo-beta-lactamase n=1 Tax=Sphingomonas rustica TaxID=3103142 RepID=A0ABV0B9E4_9SPHN
MTRDRQTPCTRTALPTFGLAIAGLALSVSLVGAALAQDDGGWTDQRREWNQPQEPFRIAGNVHYVGTAGLSAFLITDPKGHVLIDGGLPESAPLILANIRKLGFDPKDVRILLINHAHFDHSGGLAELKRATGAKLLTSAGDRADLESGHTAGRDDLLDFPKVAVDRVIADGAHIRLGRIDLVTRVTPGHTPGCTSWTTKVSEGKRSLNMVFACSISVAGRELTPEAQKQFASTFATLRGLRADIFVNFHPDAFDLAGKRKRQQAGDALAFVDPAELGRQVDAAERTLRGELAKRPN